MVESANLWEGDDLACFGALDRPGDRAEKVSARAVSIATENFPFLSIAVSFTWHPDLDLLPGIWTTDSEKTLG